MWAGYTRDEEGAELTTRARARARERDRAGAGAREREREIESMQRWLCRG